MALHLQLRASLTSDNHLDARSVMQFFALVSRTFVAACEVSRQVTGAQEWRLASVRSDGGAVHGPEHRLVLLLAHSATVRIDGVTIADNDRQLRRRRLRLRLIRGRLQSSATRETQQADDHDDAHEPSTMVT